jgi:PAS domain S-box-containing protein
LNVIKTYKVLDKKKITINALTQDKISEKLAAKNKVTEKHVVSLKQSEDRFTMLLKASEDMITVHEPNGKYIYYNGPTCYAITPEDIEGKMPNDLFDKDVSNTLMNAFKKVNKTGKSETIEVLLDWLGEKRWFSEYIYPVNNADGEIVEIVKVCRDIHQRKLAEQEIENKNKALLESDKAYRDVLKASRDLISVVDENGKIIFINHASKKFYGLLPKECLGKSIFDFTHPEDKEYTQTKFVEWGNSKKKNFYFKNRQTGAFGKTLETEWSINVERKGREIIKMTSIIRDITKQKITSRELISANKEREEFYNFYKLSPDIMLITDASGIFRSVNPSTTRLLGYSEEELTSKPFIDFVHPDDKQITLKEFEKGIKEGYSSINFENHYLCKNNEYLLLSWRVHYNGKDGVVYATACDITNERLIEAELKKSEERAFQNEEKQQLADELSLANKELTFQNEEKDELIDELTIIKNKKTLRAEALALAKEKIIVQGEEKAELIDELIIVKKEKTSRVEALAIAKEKIVVQGEEKAELIDELIIVKKEKTSRVEALAIAKEKIVAQGQEKASLVDELVIANKELAFQNEEKAKRANELEFKIKHRTKELQESLEREKELGILKTNFVSMASHEFRTPLTAISATSDIILRYYNELSRDDINLRLEKIKKEVLDMTIMLEDILIIGKSNSQKLEYNPRLINLTDTIKHIASEYQLTDPQNRSISYNLTSSDIMVMADKKWINHIVINLLSNAIKYSEENTPIEISIEEEQTGVYFSFTDYGIGITKKDIEQLFEPFHRGENVGNIPGTGLGLSVLKKAIDLHKGKIEIESEIGKGSSFKVILPSTKNR